MTTTIPVQPARIVSKARIGFLGAAAAAVVAVGILAAAAWAAPGRTLAAGSANSTASGNGVAVDGGDHRGPGGMHGFHEITITAISGSKISLVTVDGWTRTITVDASTTYESNSAAIGLADLKVGDQIGFAQTRQADGSYTIDKVAVIPPHVGGLVSAISGDTVTVTRRDGSTATFSVTSGTTWDVNGASATASDLKVGMVAMAIGTKDSSGAITATEVHAGDPGQFGGREHHGMPGWGPGHDGTDADASAAPDPTGTSNG